MELELVKEERALVYLASNWRIGGSGGVVMSRREVMVIVVVMLTRKCEVEYQVRLD